MYPDSNIVDVYFSQRSKAGDLGGKNSWLMEYFSLCDDSFYLMGQPSTRARACLVANCGPQM